MQRAVFHISSENDAKGLPPPPPEVLDSVFRAGCAGGRRCPPVDHHVEAPPDPADAQRRAVPRGEPAHLGSPSADAARDRGGAAPIPQHRVFVVAQREDQDEVLPEGLYTIGTIATLASVQRGLGGVRLVLEGLERGIALRVTRPGRLPGRDMSRARPSCSRSMPRIRRSSRCTARCANARRSSRSSAASPAMRSSRCSTQITEPGRLADLVAGYLEAPVAERQSLLEALVDRGSAAPRADPRAAPDRRAVRAGGHPVQGQGGARRPPARGLPARAAAAIQKELGEGDEGGDDVAEGAQGQARQAAAARRRPQGGRLASGRA